MEYKMQLLEKALKKAVAARQTHKSELAKLEAQTDTYSSEYIENQKSRLKNEMLAVKQSQHEEIAELLEGLKEKAEEKHSSLNLDSMEYQAALKTIELAGSELDAETVRKINNIFKGNMSVLKALKSVYKAQGISYTGGIDDFIYDIPSTYEGLRKISYESIVQDGSINRLARSISKVAESEGYEFPTMVDEAGSIEAMRKSAGLE